MGYIGNRPTAVPLTSADIQDGVITAADLGANSVDSSELVDGSIDTSHLADNQVTLAKMAGLARGKLIYGDASGDPAALAVGAADEVLTHDGTDFDWAAAGGGGKVLQVINSINTYGSQSTTSTSLVDMESGSGTTWETAITPSATSSKVLIFGNVQLMGTGNALEQRNQVALYGKIGAGAYSSLATEKMGTYCTISATSVQPNDVSGFNVLHSPSSTSACTYKFMVLTSSASVTLIPNHGSHSMITLMEIGA